MGKPNFNNNRNQQQQQNTPQHHLQRESGRIRQRNEQQQNQQTNRRQHQDVNNQNGNKNQYYNNDRHHHNHHEEEEDQQPKPPNQVAEEKYADNVNLLVLNLNSNPEQIYRQTIGKMLHSMTTPYLQKFKLGEKKTTTTTAEEEEEKNENNEEKTGDDDKKDKQNQQKKKTQQKQNQQKQQKKQDDNNEDDDHSLPKERAFFFPEDQQTATMLIHFPDKFSAKKLAQKLNQGQLFAGSALNSSTTSSGGSTSQLHASVAPTATLKPRYEPCALRITELSSSADATATNNNMTNDSSSFTLSQLQQYLSSNPGFLSVTKVARVVNASQQQQQQQNNNNNNSSSKKNNTNKSDNKNGDDSNNNNVAAAASSKKKKTEVVGKKCFVATYADSGAALQARALMSGRAFHGVHLLLELIEEENEQIVPLV